MLHVEDPKIRSLLLKCNIGLEKESLRVDENGHFSHSAHPFTEKHIGTDFCKNQTEVNTPVAHSPAEAVASLETYHTIIEKTLSQMQPREYLWPFSNPPYIVDEDDIEKAPFSGELEYKNDYSRYIERKYGRYKMTFSGIHFNYSFADELLEREFELSGETDFSKFKNDFYVALAERAAVYGWIVTAITAASPVMDSSFFEEKVFDKTVFFGMASVRASEFGYWNYFAPILNYTDVRSYADSIQQYVDMGVLRVPGELYYPIRLKPRGLNNLPRLREEGVDHIELRMIDLNPLVPAGIDERDVFFCQLLLVWLAATERQPWGRADQVQAIQNFKNAAHYDLNTVHMVIPDGRVYSVQEAALHIIAFLEEFYKDFPQDVQDCLAFQKKKFTNPETRYAWQIRERFGEDFVKKGMELAKERQELYL